MINYKKPNFLLLRLIIIADDEIQDKDDEIQC